MSGNRIGSDWKEHLNNTIGISRKDQSTLINNHFTQKNNTGVNDMIIYKLDFGHGNTASKQCKKLSLEKESTRISRLRTPFPDGLNYLELKLISESIYCSGYTVQIWSNV